MIKESYFENNKWVRKDAMAPYYGMKIHAAEIVNHGHEEALRLVFKGKKAPKIEIFDGGQDCCEHRYMTCDDKVKSLKGGILQKVEVVDTVITKKYGDPHEQCFVKIETDKGFITICTHNEHNGYYGGFSLRVRELS
jgi:hypothetical protein